ncbi:MAG TPA: 4-alpha-glucanotransferase, partial [Thermodesulfovibrionales bacterium]|nr:4-alpha-glucanotransferase [Thermodesulfovibrionales bacterium]
LPGYWDIFGTWHTATPETKREILAAMKLKVGSAEDIDEEIRSKETRQWRSFLAPVHVIAEHEQPLAVPVFIPVEPGGERGLSVSLVMADEHGRADEVLLSGDALSVDAELVIDGQRYIRTLLNDTVRRTMGYYTLTVTVRGAGSSGALQKRSKVIITPETCHLPEDVCERGLWGLAVNLYAIRSGRNWGVGDFTDLGELCRHIAEMHGSFVGLNPLHAIPNTRPYGISPYSPVSRLFRNVIYLDVEAVQDVAESAAARAAMDDQLFRTALQELREAASLDYEKVSALKVGVLRHAFQHFHDTYYVPDTARGRDFRAYLESEGETLRSFGLYLELREHFITAGNVYAWQDWPSAYRDHEQDAVRQFRRDHETGILFHCYVQWLLDRQLADVQTLCNAAGMEVGLYHDLAVGAIGGGSDIWMYQDVAAGADVGAPPDDFNPNGQNWGFPALIPEKMRETGYELFIETLRQNMQHGGALRIDHALGLFRGFWIPSGMSPKEGGYVRQTARDLLRIIALESRRNRTIVIAEDLGTIDEEFRVMLQQFRILSYRLFYFERNYPDPSFKAPQQYVPTALCAVTTHDLPTLYGYWEGHDINVKDRIGIYADDQARQQDHTARQQDRRLILSALRKENLLPDDFPEDPVMVPHLTPLLCSAIYRYLARTPCRMVLASLDDIIGTVDQQNLPGTVDLHPNWVQRTPLALEAIFRDERFLDLKEIFRERSGR